MAQTLAVYADPTATRAPQSLAETSPKAAIEMLAGGHVEACSQYHGRVVASPFHPLVAAIHDAFCDHRALVLSPDMFWLLITQGLARHINEQPEELRSRFVQHQGKAKLEVRRDDFLKGSPENPWPDVFAEFSAQIQNHIGAENHGRIVAEFSTTGPVERAANEVVLLDALQSYFEYDFVTMCGIPEVALEGTVADWEKLAQLCGEIGAAYDLRWWTDRIQPRLSRIARNAAGVDDPALWRDIYKIDNSSGGPYSNGWIIEFFPYLQTTGYLHKERSTLCEDWRERLANPDDYREVQLLERNWLFTGRGRGVQLPDLPGSLCRAPFQWHYLSSVFSMEFLAGFIGFTQNAETLAVRPHIGWAVRETKSA